MRAWGLALPLLVAALAGCTGSPPAPASDQGTSPAAGANPVVLLNTSMGDIRLELFLDKTPITAGNFLNLTRQAFYDGTRFHRVIGPAKSPPDGFMIQDGDPLTKDAAAKSRWGTGGPGYNIRDEFPCKDGTVSGYVAPPGKPCDGHGGLATLHDKAGVVSMANTGQPDSGGSQYFITLAATPFLNGKHAVFGRVAEGMEVVRAIGNVPTESPDRPVQDVVIHRVTVVSG